MEPIKNEIELQLLRQANLSNVGFIVKETVSCEVCGHASYMIQTLVVLNIKQCIDDQY